MYPSRTVLQGRHEARNTKALTPPRLTGYLVIVRIAESARKHQVTDDGVRHAARLAIGSWPMDDDLSMLVGPARSGALLEVGVLGVNSDDPVIVHAMPCRPKFLPH